MTFKEAFEHYRIGTASAEERTLVEEEIEKARLITEYLDEDWNIPTLTDEAPIQDMKLVRRNIRKRNVLIVLTSIVLCMAIFLTSWLVIIPTLEKHYWNPKANNAGVTYSTDLEAMLAVYAELICPNTGIGKVSSTKTGFATYDLSIQHWKLNGNYVDNLYANATLEKGELKLPDGLLETVPTNIFTRATYPFYSEDTHSPSIYELMQLPDYVTITATVSFEYDMSIEEVLAFDNTLVDGRIGWVGIRNSPTDVQLQPLCGFIPHQSGSVRDELNDTYPALEIKGMQKTAANWEDHFTSMLRFLDGQYNNGTCIKLHGTSSSQSYYKEVLDYVEANGIYSYGCYVTGTPETFVKLLKTPAVEQIWIQDSWLNIN